MDDDNPVPDLDLVVTTGDDDLVSSRDAADKHVRLLPEACELDADNLALLGNDELKCLCLIRKLSEILDVAPHRVL